MKVIMKLESGLLSEDEDSTDGQSQQSYAASSGFENFRRRRRRRSRSYPDFSSSKYFKFCENLKERCKRHKKFAQEYYGSGTTGRAGRGYSSFFDGNFPNYQAYHDPGEANRWLRQAKADLVYARRSIDIEGNPAAFNWICYLCHQATEKSLKAAWFAKDANKVKRLSHDICGLAEGLTDRVRGPVQELSALVGEHTKMRYPDVLERPKIPSTVYSRQQAERACELSREIVSLVGDEYSISGS